jgi:hypothetical protein
MDKTEFLGSEQAWWLLEPDLPPTLEDLRRDLGAAFEWRYDLWYTEPLRIEALYEWIERNSYQLLSELDDATDEVKRQTWLETLLEAVRPPEEDQAAPASAPAEAAPGTGTAAPSAPAVATGTAPARKSIFARKEAADDDDGAGPAAPAAGSAEVAGEAEAAPAAAATKAAPAPAPPPEAPSLFARKRAAEAAPAAPAASAAPASEPADAPAPAAPATVEEVQAAVSALAPDEVTGLAEDLGMDGDELNALLADPAFQALVAEEGAKLS